MIKYDWDNIIKDLKNGLSRRDVEAKYKVPTSTLNSRINQKNPDLKSRPPRKRNEKTRELVVKIKPIRQVNQQCPIMQKIEIIKMLNKQIPHAQIARELKIDVLELEKLIHKIKSGVK
jgi:transposase